MHLASLSSQLNLSINELRAKAAAANIRIPPRAAKVDNATAKRILDLFDSASSREKTPVNTKPTSVKIPAFLPVRDLAVLLNQSVNSVIKKLIENGVLAGINETLDFDTASIIANEFGVEAEAEGSSDNRLSVGYVKEVLDAENAADMTERPAVVAVMGHVDHGKTTLLDAIRKTDVVSGESGGITQHIGAYAIEHQGKKLTFLDTPGHEAFSAMRARGAGVTDIIVLVVAADDGVRPQTVEVINRAKFAKIPLVVAINKVDAPGANVQKVLQELATAGVLVESWGGQTMYTEVSARSGQGISELLDSVVLQSEVLQLKANHKGQAVGTVIEAHSQTGQGAIATVIVQNGTVHVGDVVVAGEVLGKIKSISDSFGKKLKSVGPGEGARISGLSGLPQAGDILCVVENLEVAKSRAESVRRQERSKRLRGLSQVQADVANKQLNLILKADVSGSLEAVKESLEQIKTDDVKVTIIDASVGDVTDSDVLRATASHAFIIAFRVKVKPSSLVLAKNQKVVIDKYDIIYELIADVTDAALKLCTPEYEKTEVGKLKILAIFRTEKDSQIIGCSVASGEIRKTLPLLVQRDGIEIGQAKILELQQNKVLTDLVSQGQECGLKVSTQSKLKIGDELIGYTETLKKKTLV